MSLDAITFGPHFSAAEYRCSHCNGDGMRDGVSVARLGEFCHALNTIRARFKAPLVVTSWYRCGEHPQENWKSSYGPHRTGLAVDFGIERSEAVRLLPIIMDVLRERDWLAQAGFGFNQRGRGRFIHVDVAGFEAKVAERPAMWSYA